MQDALRKGLEHHVAGRLVEAETAYRQVLDLQAEHPVALHYLGVLAHGLGRSEFAVDLMLRAARQLPDDAQLLKNLGGALISLRRLDEAETALLQAIERDPTLADAHLSLGNARRQQGRWDEAEACYRRTVELNPASALGWGNLGALLFDRARLAESAEAFARRMSCSPIARELNRSPQGFGAGRLAHELDQIDYLARAGIDTPALRARRQEAAAALATLAGGGTLDERRLEAALNRPSHIAPAPAFADGALNAALDAPGIQARWRAAPAPILVVDQLLSEAALASLQQFLRESTIWYWCSANGNYVGAFDNAGLLAPLMVQVAEELPARFPAIFDGHRIKKIWTFKYANAVPGISLHADEAAVNVNFWITPDAANLAPEQPALTIWDRAAPGEWDFRAFNDEASVGQIEARLRAAGAKPVPVPYRCNRAVIFDSTLFHGGNPVRFGPAYEDRRINVTLLYGDRRR